MAKAKQRGKTRRKGGTGGSEVAFAIDAKRLRQIKACLDKGELRLSLKGAKVSITEQGLVLDAYAWD